MTGHGTRCIANVIYDYSTISTIDDYAVYFSTSRGMKLLSSYIMSVFKVNSKSYEH